MLSGEIQIAREDLDSGLGERGHLLRPPFSGGGGPQYPHRYRLAGRWGGPPPSHPAGRGHEDLPAAHLRVRSDPQEHLARPLTRPSGARDPKPHRRAGPPLADPISLVISDNVIPTSLSVKAITRYCFRCVIEGLRGRTFGPDMLRAAAELLATGGRSAVTTRAVSAAAGVQPPRSIATSATCMDLLDVAARDTLAVHAARTGDPPHSLNDPVDDLRRGWDLHIAFGLAHPDAFALLYSAPSVDASIPVIHEGVAVLQASSPASPRPGGSCVDAAHATDLIHAAGTGVALTLAATPT